jgi:hypothetical protein
LQECLPDDRTTEFYRCQRIFKKTKLALRRNHRGGIDNNGFDILIIVVGQTQKKQTGLGGDGNAYFIGKYKSAGAFPIFFGDENLDQFA